MFPRTHSQLQTRTINTHNNRKLDSRFKKRNMPGKQAYTHTNRPRVDTATKITWEWRTYSGQKQGMHTNSKKENKPKRSGHVNTNRRWALETRGQTGPWTNIYNMGIIHCLHGVCLTVHFLLLCVCVCGVKQWVLPVEIELGPVWILDSRYPESECRPYHYHPPSIQEHQNIHGSY